MEWVQARIVEGSQIISRLLMAPDVSFGGLTPKQIPDEPGLYLIFEKVAGDGKFLRAGRTDDGGLRQRLYKNHLMGNQRGNLPAQLVRDGRCRTISEAKSWIRDHCVSRFIIERDAQKRVWAEHFILAVLRPEFGN